MELEGSSTAIPAYATKAVWDTFSCPICMESMDGTDAKSPRVMCRNLHSICHACAVKMADTQNTMTCVVCRQPSINNHFVKVPVVTKLVEATSALHTACSQLDGKLTSATAFSDGICILQDDPFTILKLQSQVAELRKARIDELIEHQQTRQNLIDKHMQLLLEHEKMMKMSFFMPDGQNKRPRLTRETAVEEEPRAPAAAVAPAAEAPAPAAEAPAAAPAVVVARPRPPPPPPPPSPHHVQPIVLLSFPGQLRTPPPRQRSGDDGADDEPPNAPRADRRGMVRRPPWYPPLTIDSSDEEFDTLLQ